MSIVGEKVNFKKAKLPLNKNLLGKSVILEPLSVKRHAKDLFNNFSKDSKNIIWRYLPYGPFINFSLFKKWLQSSSVNKDPFFYAIYSKRLKQYCGMASYLRITPDHGTIEVGHINYAPILQNTREGTETMYLLMKNAFSILGNRRYEWKCHNLNSDSKRAALRLGFKFEGIFRQNNVFKGRNRDTAWFSIIDKEWKKIKVGYVKYLSNKNFDKNFNQKNKLKTR
jgi:RimJ/RimL family protein N-acetyltransferase